MGTNKNTATDLTTVEAYVAADRKGRAGIRTATDRIMRDRLASGDLNGAQAAMARLAEYKLAAGAVTATEVNWPQLVANRIATLREVAAMADLGHGINLPDDVDVDMDALPVGEVDTDMIGRIMATPLRRSARKNDVSALITAAFIGQPVNTRLSVADVVRHARQNGSDVGNGAVTARATADVWTGHAGIVQVASDKNGPIGFRNVMLITDDGDEA